jgi:hypothetical protein
LSELPKACQGEYCLQVSTKKQGEEKDIYRFQQKVQEGFDPFESNLK